MTRSEDEEFDERALELAIQEGERAPAWLVDGVPVPPEEASEAALAAAQELRRELDPAARERIVDLVVDTYLAGAPAILRRSWPIPIERAPNSAGNRNSTISTSSYAMRMPGKRRSSGATHDGTLHPLSRLGPLLDEALLLEVVEARRAIGPDPVQLLPREREAVDAGDHQSEAGERHERADHHPAHRRGRGVPERAPGGKREQRDRHPPGREQAPQLQGQRASREVGPGEQAEDPELLKALDDLAKRQQRVYQATYDLSQGRND